MKKIFFFLSLIIIILLSSCTRKEEPVLAPLTSGKIDGKVLWKRITVDSDYKNYAFWPDHEGLQPGQAPHGVYHKIFINKVLRDALPAKDRKAPDGSIIVKENFNSTKDLTVITVIAKVRGYNPRDNDWYWAKYSPAGEVLASGTPASCIGCHEGMKDNDYIIVQPLDSTPAR